MPQASPLQLVPARVTVSAAPACVMCVVSKLLCWSRRNFTDREPAKALWS